MRIIDVVQGSEEWWSARRGRPTASSFNRIVTPKTGKMSAGAESFIHELIAERYRLAPTTEGEQYRNRAMQAGIDTEPEARRWYEMECGEDVRQVGFVLDDADRFGCSPDGLVGEDGGLELKCPELKTHVAYLLAGALPDEYKWQVYGNLLITGREWWDFMSYATDLPPFRIRVTRDKNLDLLATALDSFWTDFQTALAKIHTLAGVPPCQ